MVKHTKKIKFERKEKEEKARLRKTNVVEEGREKEERTKKETSDKKLKRKDVGKGILVVGLLLLMFYLCSHFMEYQKNATSQVNKYRIDQVALLSDRVSIEQRFTAKHTHLKTVKVYFSNDYTGAAGGKLILEIVETKTGKAISRIEKKVSKLANNDYTEFKTDVQLEKGEKYSLRLKAVGTSSGTEPIVYQWTTKESGFYEKLRMNSQLQTRYLVAKFYYPVTIYFQWIYIGLITFALIFLVLFGLPLPKKWASKINTVLGTILWLGAPFFTYWFVERFTDNTVFKINVGFSALNLMLYFMFYGLLCLLFYSRRVAIAVGMIAWYIAGLANYYVVLFKGSPVVPSDFMSASTAFSVAENYTYQIQPVFVWNALWIALYLMVLFRAPMSWKLRWKPRVILLLVIAIVGTIFGSLVIEQKTLKSVGVKNNVWDQKKGYAKNGMFLGFVLNLNSLVQEKPSKYSVESAETIAEKYAEYFANQGKKEGSLETFSGKKPNIIAIMNEAFSDLSTVGEFETNEDYMPFIHSLEENTIKGSLYMSIFGSGTCNSEFEFLTGNTTSFLQNGIIAYTQIIKGKVPNITYQLMADGYVQSMALHPYLATGWNRVEVYEEMGFQAFYSQDDFEDPLMYRKYISDESDFKKIEELYENRSYKTQPFYLFNVTMQNHGGFDKIYSNFNHDIQITDGHKDQTAEQYLSLVKKSDEAFKELVEYFSKVKEPTIIVMFGDHQPSVKGSFYESIMGKTSGELTQEEIQTKYQTPFIIWANYDITEQTDVKMSANYLGAYVMSEAGLELSPYQQFILKLKEDMPIITAMGSVDKDGNFYESALDSPYSDMVKEYQILQYNNLIDIDHTVESFFYPEVYQKKE